MKKLNALVSAISLGMTVSFAALPVASAHSALNVGHSHTVHAHQKHTFKDDRKPYHVATRHHLADVCANASIWPVKTQSTSVDSAMSQGTQLSNQSGTLVATVTAPSECANTIDATVQWTPTVVNLDADSDDDVFNIATELDCQWFEDDTPVGPTFKQNAPLEIGTLAAFESDDTTPTTPITMSTSVFAPPKPTAYAYGPYGHEYGRLHLDTFSLFCNQAAVHFDEDAKPETTPLTTSLPSQIQVSGNDVAAKSGPDTFQPVYTNQLAGADSGYPGYYARHHMKVKH